MNPQLDPAALKDLVNAGVYAFAVPIAFLMQFAVVLATAAVPGELPRWSDVGLAFLAAAASVFFVSIWHSYLAPDLVPSMMTDVRIQSFLLWLLSMVGHQTAVKLYGSGRPPSTADELRAYVGKADPIVVEKAGVSMTVTGSAPATRNGAPMAIVGGFLVALALALAPAVHADEARALPWVSLQRLAGGVALQSAIYSNGVADGHVDVVACFAPKAYLSYSLLDEVSVHVSEQVGIGKARVNELRAGGAVRLVREDPVRFSVGIDAVHYSGSTIAGLDPADVVEYSARFSKVLKRERGAPRAGLQLHAGYIPGAGRKLTYRIALNLPLFGGEVIQ